MLKLRKVTAFVILMAVLLPIPSFVFAAAVPNHPLFGVQEQEIVEPKQRHINVLLLGIDYGFENYWGSYNKTDLAECHTDAVMVVSINQITKQMSLISVPRDTLVYVPGVRGVYKLNAAFNCADSTEEGLKRSCSTVSMLLGGISIDYYCAVDIGTMMAVGDFIGGIDFDLEMNYVGSSGISYKKGLQHLDGTGIIDYMRARRNATINDNDLGRTERQRKMVSALFNMLCEQPEMIKNIWNFLHSDGMNFFSNMSLGAAINLSNIYRNHYGELASYVLTGKYRTCLNGWNFTFTDQDNRIKVIKEVFDIEVEPLDYVNYSYTEWLVEDGFAMCKFLVNGQRMVDYIESNRIAFTDEQNKVADEVVSAYNDAVSAFEHAARREGDYADAQMLRAKTELRRKCRNSADILQYTVSLDWYENPYWNEDEMVNEYSEIIWH